SGRGSAESRDAARDESATLAHAPGQRLGQRIAQGLDDGRIVYIDDGRAVVLLEEETRRSRLWRCEGHAHAPVIRDEPAAQEPLDRLADGALQAAHVDDRALRIEPARRQAQARLQLLEAPGREVVLHAARVAAPVRRLLGPAHRAEV